MGIELEELTHKNAALAAGIDRSDIGEDFVDTVDTIIEYTDYGVEHGCIGHTFVIKKDSIPIGLILLGEAIEWETDPPEMKREPFYRLMGFVIDKKYRGRGLGGQALELVIAEVYKDFGIRPIALGCHRENERAAEFYIRHGFHKMAYMEGNDMYYLRYPQK